MTITERHSLHFFLHKQADREVFTERELIRLGQSRAAALYRTQKQAVRMHENHSRSHSTTPVGYHVGEFVKLKNNTKTVFDFNFHGPFMWIALAGIIRTICTLLVEKKSEIRSISPIWNHTSLLVLRYCLILVRMLVGGYCCGAVP